MDIERSDMDILMWISKDLSPLFLRTINRNLPGLAFNELTPPSPPRDQF